MKRTIFAVAIIAVVVGGYFVLPVVAKTKDNPGKKAVATCERVAAVKKNVALKSAQKIYVMALKQTKNDKVKKAEAKEALKQAQKTAKEVFAADRKACISAVQQPVPQSSASEPSAQQPAPQPSMGQTPVAEEKVVTYTDLGYSPSALTVKKGETVTFKNQSSQSMWTASGVHPTHTLYPTTGGCIGSAFDACAGIQPGASWSFKFDIAGTWKYHNHLSPGNTGTIIVE